MTDIAGAKSPGEKYHEHLKGNKEYFCEREEEKEEVIKELEKEEGCFHVEKVRSQPVLVLNSDFDRKGSTIHEVKSHMQVSGQGKVKLYLNLVESVFGPPRESDKLIKTFNFDPCGGEERYYHKLSTHRTTRYVYRLENVGNDEGCRKQIPCM